MKIKKYKNSEKGFAIALALLMLLVMSLMGATLVMVAGSDHKKNAVKDSSQQAFYAAETGIAQAKKWLLSQTSLSANNDPNPNLKFCKTSLFSNLSSVKAINNYVDSKRLDEIITVSGDEKKRLEKYTEKFPNKLDMGLIRMDNFDGGKTLPPIGKKPTVGILPPIGETQELEYVELKPRVNPNRVKKNKKKNRKNRK